MRVDDLCAFIEARERHRRVKAGLVTNFNATYLDPIIAQYRFCNVRRNDDRVTKFILQWSWAWDGNPHQWFVFVVARLFNQPETLNDISKYVLPFRPTQMALVLHQRKRAGQRNFNPAYIVSTNGHAMDKVEYLIKHVLEPLWAKRAPITASLKGATLAQAHELFKTQNGLGSFMAAQVLADLKYVDPDRWPDFHTFAASGPGSKRGLSRVMTGALGRAYTEKQFRNTLSLLHEAVNAKLQWSEPLTAQDLQNCLCEFDKYERARLGEGRPKQKYVPHKEKSK